MPPPSASEQRRIWPPEIIPAANAVKRGGSRGLSSQQTVSRPLSDTATPGARRQRLKETLMMRAESLEVTGDADSCTQTTRIGGDIEAGAPTLGQQLVKR